MITNYDIQVNIDGKNYPIIDAEAQKSLVYSQNETDTGKIWIDGKKIYRKVINCGALPDNKEKETPHNIKDYDTFLSIRGIAIYRQAKSFISLPFSAQGNESIKITILGENIVIGTYIVRQYFTESYAILEYTKTTN